MLKKNLVKSGLIGHGLLCIIPTTTGFQIEPRYAYREQPALVKSVHVTLDTFSTGTDTVALVPPPPPIGLNKNAERFVKNFMNREDEFLQKMKQKSPSFFRTINAVFNQYGVPEELKYLAIVESQLKTTAVSRVGAKGMWQFMPVTAKEMGLKISGKTDERTHFYKSTVAAAKYLRYLHKEFDGDWLLAIAAYNGGPGTVYKAIRKSGSRNFWALQRYLPEESRGHVKRFIGVHYFFEGKGSIATQTRSEAMAYQKLMDAYQNTVKAALMVKDSTTLVALTEPVK